MNNTSNIQTVEMSYGRITKQADNLLYLFLHDQLSIDVAEAQAMVTDVRDLAQSDQIRLLVSYGVNSDLTFGAQRYFANVTGFTHVAFVVHNRMQAEVGQFLVSMLRVFKSNYEFKLFYDVEAAENWLRKQ